MKKLAVLGLSLLAIGLAGCSSGQKIEENKKAEGEVTIYLVRHGKTFFNTTGQVQGFSDSPLTDVGIEQAEKVGEGLKDISFDAAYSGDLGRQRNTAKLILSKNKQDIPALSEHEGFKEWNYGGYEGKSNAEMWTPIMKEYDLTFDEDWTDYEKLVDILGDEGIADAIAANDKLKAAESYAEITKRGKAAMKELVEKTEKNGGGNVLAVSSGGMIPTLLTLVVPEQYEGQDIGNCSVTVLTYKDGTYTLGKVGDTSYLEE